MNPSDTLDDLRVTRLKALIPPALLIEQHPIQAAGKRCVAETREAIARVLKGADDRLVVVVGPCSIHDVTAAREYGERLRKEAARFSSELVVVMRVYFEKPRTTVGWKGLVNDPRLDESFQINEGLVLARSLLVDLAEQGVPAGCEFLDTILPQFTADLVSWGAIGARTTESQVHRELASGLSMPVGFKNGTNGNVDIAIEAVRAASCPHHFLGLTKEGVPAIVATRGNDSCHIILRGGRNGPNFDRGSLAEAVRELESAQLSPRVMVDCSHGNSRKIASQQPAVAKALAEQVTEGSRHLFGVMVESNLVGGRQDLTPERPLTYGQSITDACLSWADTVPVLEDLARAVERRRASPRQASPLG